MPIRLKATLSPNAKPLLQRKLQAYAQKDKDLRNTWVASMCERFEAARAVEVLNIDWLHTEEQVTHTELFVTQYEAQLNKTKPRPPHDCDPRLRHL